MIRALITGGAGFIGSHLAEALLAPHKWNWQGIAVGLVTAAVMVLVDG